MKSKAIIGCLSAALALSAAGAVAQGFRPGPGAPIGFDHNPFGHESQTATPIKHLVVIFGENISFDHYFGTYPHATNPPGEPRFTALPYTPEINGLSPTLLNKNPNLKSANNVTTSSRKSVPSNPFRIDRAQAETADQNHGYTAEQQAYDDGKMDLFPLYTGTSGAYGSGQFSTTALVMGYYDGNTVTALWNYAQHFALNDNSYGSQFGPSSPGAIDLVSGQTNGVIGYNAGSTAAQQAAVMGGSGGVSPVNATNGFQVADGQGGFTLYSDADPTGDACSTTSSATATLTGKNIGDLLNARKISWGWFQGGFDLTLTDANGNTGCKRAGTETVPGGGSTADYVQHHEPFQYYASTRNLNHTRPTSVTAIGTANDGGANHQYDTHDFFDALKAGNLPAVTFLKAPAFQDGHAGYSDPIDEQTFIVNVINAVQQSPFWGSTAVVIAYDDSDGWYDHANAVINPSTSVEDALITTGECGPLNGHEKLTPGTVPSQALPGLKGKPVNGRCGYGTRQPLLVISPWSKHNFVDHTLTDQSSIIRFVEDNWLGGERIGQGNYDAVAGSLDNMFDFHQAPTTKLILDPNLGTPVF